MCRHACRNSQQESGAQRTHTCAQHSPRARERERESSRTSPPYERTTRSSELYSSWRMSPRRTSIKDRNSRTRCKLIIYAMWRRNSTSTSWGVCGELWTFVRELWERWCFLCAACAWGLCVGLRGASEAGFGGSLWGIFGSGTAPSPSRVSHCSSLTPWRSVCSNREPAHLSPISARARARGARKRGGTARRHPAESLRLDPGAAPASAGCRSEGCARVSRTSRPSRPNPRSSPVAATRPARRSPCRWAARTWRRR